MGDDAADNIDGAGDKGAGKVDAAFDRKGLVFQEDLAWLVDFLRNTELDVRLLTFWATGARETEGVVGTLLAAKEAVPAVIEQFLSERNPLPMVVQIFTPGRPNQDHVLIGFSGPAVCVPWPGGQPAADVADEARELSSGSDGTPAP